jgi:hypothetical protein
MKRNLITSFVYLLGGLSFGVFYREFTKWNGFVGPNHFGGLPPPPHRSRNALIPRPLFRAQG